MISLCPISYPKRFIIVEDEIVVRRAIRAFLELHHFEICGEQSTAVEPAKNRRAAPRSSFTLGSLHAPHERHSAGGLPS